MSLNLSLLIIRTSVISDEGFILFQCDLKLIELILSVMILFANRVTFQGLRCTWIFRGHYPTRCTSGKGKFQREQCQQLWVLQNGPENGFKLVSVYWKAETCRWRLSRLYLNMDVQIPSFLPVILEFYWWLVLERPSLSLRDGPVGVPCVAQGSWLWSNVRVPMPPLEFFFLIFATTWFPLEIFP